MATRNRKKKRNYRLIITIVIVVFVLLGSLAVAKRMGVIGKAATKKVSLQMLYPQLLLRK